MAKEKVKLNLILEVACDIAASYGLKISSMYDCNSDSSWFAPIFFHCEKKKMNDLFDSLDLLISYNRITRKFSIVTPLNNTGFYQMEAYQRRSVKITKLNIISDDEELEFIKNNCYTGVNLPDLSKLLSLDLMMRSNIN